MTKRCALVLLIGVLLLGSTGCSLFSSSGPDDALRAFAEALQRRDAGAAAAATDDPDAATPVITSMFDGMGKNASVTVDVAEPDDAAENQATTKLGYTWTFGPDRTLHYEATATATKTARAARSVLDSGRSLGTGIRLLRFARSLLFVPGD